MNLEIIRGPQGSGKTTKLRAILSNAGKCGVEIPSGEWSTSALHRTVIRMTERSATTICIDDCSEEALRDLDRLCRSSSKWAGVTVYAVARC